MRMVEGLKPLRVITKVYTGKIESLNKTEELHEKVVVFPVRKRAEL